MPAVKRDILIVYGGYSVGGTTDRLLHDYHQVRKAFVDAQVRFKFVVTGDDDESFGAACAGAERAFSNPFQDLSITQDGAGLLTGVEGTDLLNAQPEINKAGDDFDTGRSRLYEVTIDFEVPATQAPTKGLREVEVGVTYAASRRRTVAFTGVWTAIGGSAATDEYEGGVEAFCDAALNALSGTFELVDEQHTADYQDNVLGWTRTYHEILYGQGATSPLDSTKIVEQVAGFERRLDEPGDYPDGDTNRLVELNVTYDCELNSEEVSGLAPMQSLWDNTIEPWLLNEAKTTVQAKAVALVGGGPKFYPDQPRITASLKVMAATGSDILKNEIVIQDRIKVGVQLVPVWSGKSTDKYRYDGPSDVVRIVHQTVTFFGTLDAGFAARRGYARALRFRQEPMDFAPLQVSQPKWVVVGRDSNVAPKRMGKGKGFVLQTTECTFTTTLEIYTVPSGSGGAITPGPSGGDTGPSSIPVPTPSTR